ncbi:MAG: Hsp33 family molecular chaperone HslO [Candidatus Cloacimonetes bacterium]|nr:Hsp33 family molecular chaperone HslO [Candidatus Cloacimonadota bacterium]
MKDKIIRGITGDKQIRFFAVDSTETVKHAVNLHNLSITNSVLLGRLISAALMMAMDLASDNSEITLKVEADGPVGGAIVTANKKGEVKGYINNPQVELPLQKDTGMIDIPGAIGKGHITIIKDLGMKNQYIGKVELKFGTIAKDFTYYFMKSEKIPSSVGLGVLIEPDGTVRQAGGFIVQLMPDTPEKVISKLENNLANFPNLTDVMDMGYSIEEIIEKYILKDLEPQIKRKIPSEYKCNCSYEKFENDIRLLENKELEEAIKKNEVLTVHCHFCNKDYEFGKVRIEKILERM